MHILMSCQRFKYYGQNSLLLLLIAMGYSIFACSYTIVDYKLEQYFSLTPNQPIVNNPRSFTTKRTGGLFLVAPSFSFWHVACAIVLAEKHRVLEAEMVREYKENTRAGKCEIRTWHYLNPCARFNMIALLSATILIHFQTY